MRSIKKWLQVFFLSVKDLWFDRQVSVCIIAAMAAVIAPLLLLFGLKYGVITAMQNDLLSDPRNLEVKMMTAGSFDQNWLDELRKNPDVGFAVGLTRSLNTLVDVVGVSGRFIENAEVIPSVAPDPLLPMITDDLALGEVVVSTAVANKLGIGPGDIVKLNAKRKINGAYELASKEFSVIAVAAEKHFPRSGVFVSPELLYGLEVFRDGYQSHAWGIYSGGELGSGVKKYAKARVYATELDAVKRVVDLLATQDVDVVSNVAGIENVKAINRLLGVIFSVIAGAALLGCVSSLFGSIFSNIDRKRKSVAVLQLLGLTQVHVFVYVVFQVVLLSVVSYACGFLIYQLGAMLFNNYLVDVSGASNYLCDLLLEHIVYSFLMTVLIAFSIAAISAVRVAAIQPAECLREI